MKKSTLLLLFVIQLFAINSYGYIMREYFPDGAIKENGVLSYSVYDSLANGELKLAFRVDFDTEGREISYYNFESFFEHSFYENGLMKIRDRHPFGSIEPMIKEEYFYNEKGELIKKESHDVYSGDRQYFYKYNNGLLIETNYGTKPSYKYMYDSLGNQILEISFYNGEVSRKRKFVYDDNNNLIWEYRISKANDTTTRAYFEYNNKNLLVSESYFDENNVLSQYYKRTFYDNNCIKSHEQYTDIKNGDLSRATPKIHIYKYQYSIPKESKEGFSEKHNNIIIKQNDKEFLIDKAESEITINMSPFKVQFFNKKFNIRTREFYMARVVALTDKTIFETIKDNSKVEFESIFGSSSGMSGGDTPFEVLYVKDANHVLAYENEYSTKLNLISEENNICKFELDVNGLSLNKQDLLKDNKGIKKVYLAIFVDRDLDNYIDEGELRKIVLKLK